MCSIKNKIQSKSGSSMLLAIMFFLICVFVGGTVLAAATANGGRLATRQRQRQAYYTQRSAAMLLREQFRGQPKMEINKITKSVQEIRTQGSTTVSTTKNYLVEAKLSENQSPLQTMISKAVLKLYWEQSGANSELSQFFSSNNVSLVTKNGVTEQKTPCTQAGLPGTQGELSIEVDGKIVNVQYECSYEDENDFADITFTIQGDEGSLFTVSVPASISFQQSSGGETDPQGSNVTIITRTSYDTTVVIWNDPVISKGEGNAE